MKIDNWNSDQDTLIVAEIGNNHEGSYGLAEELIGLAAQAGAGAVKFQSIIPERLVPPNQTERIQQLKKFQLSYEEYEKLSKVATKEGMLFLSTPFDIETVQFLNNLVPAFKIASGDNNFFPLIESVARTNKPIILSTGLTDMQEITITVDFVRRIWNELGIAPGLALLHCIAAYPVPSHDANLLAIRTLSNQFEVTVGYSDHTIGIDAAVASVAVGARIVEKHFTIDKEYSNFGDHKLSADPQDFGEMVQRIKLTFEILGDGNKRIQESEQVPSTAIRRSIVASRDLKAGTILQMEDLTWLRPGGGVSPGQELKLVGKKLIHSIDMGNLIQLDNVIEE